MHSRKSSVFRIVETSFFSLIARRTCECECSGALFVDCFDINVMRVETELWPQFGLILY